MLSPVLSLPTAPNLRAGRVLFHFGNTEKSEELMNCRTLCAVFLLVPLTVGCGEDTGGITFASANGVVTYKGSPVAGAQILAFPEKGPIAYGSTNDEGKFELKTSPKTGVAVGKIRVAVVVAGAKEEDYSSSSTAASGDPATSTQGTMQSMQKFDEIQKKKKKGGSDKSPLAKYASETTSGLSYEIQSGNNDLKIELK